MSNESEQTDGQTDGKAAESARSGGARARGLGKCSVVGKGARGGGNTHRGPPVRNALVLKNYAWTTKKASGRQAQDGVAVVGGWWPQAQTSRRAGEPAACGSGADTVRGMMWGYTCRYNHAFLISTILS